MTNLEIKFFIFLQIPENKESVRGIVRIVRHVSKWGSEIFDKQCQEN